MTVGDGRICPSDPQKEAWPSVALTSNEKQRTTASNSEKRFLTVPELKVELEARRSESAEWGNLEHEQRRRRADAGQLNRVETSGRGGGHVLWVSQPAQSPDLD